MNDWSHSIKIIKKIIDKRYDEEINVKINEIKINFLSQSDIERHFENKSDYYSLIVFQNALNEIIGGYVKLNKGSLDDINRLLSYELYHQLIYIPIKSLTKKGSLLFIDRYGYRYVDDFC